MTQEYIFFCLGVTMAERHCIILHFQQILKVSIRVKSSNYLLQKCINRLGEEVREFEIETRAGVYWRNI